MCRLLEEIAVVLTGGNRGTKIKSVTQCSLIVIGGVDVLLISLDVYITSMVAVARFSDQEETITHNAPDVFLTITPPSLGVVFLLTVDSGTNPKDSTYSTATHAQRTSVPT